MADLRKQLAELREELAVLTECLLASRAVTANKLAGIRRQRHAVRAWQEVLSVPELCIDIAIKSGLSAAKNLSLVSRVNVDGIRGVLPAVAKQTPAQLVVVGGCVGPPPSSGSGDELVSLEQVDALDMRSNHWVPLTCMHYDIVGCAAAVLGSCLYVVGGQHAGCVLDSLWTFDPAVKEDWRQLAQMPTRRSLCAAVAAGGSLYVTGGHDHMNQPRGSLESYDPKADTWAKLSPMPTARLAVGSAASGFCVFVLGGKSRSKMASATGNSRHGAVRGTAEGFNLASGTWVTLPPMPTARAGCSAAAHGGRVYVVGGEAPVDPLVQPAGDELEHDVWYNALPPAFSVLEVFDIILGTWSVLPPMPTPRGASAAATVGGRIYVVGGATMHGTPLSTVECFDPVRGSWSSMEPLSRPRARCAAVALRH